MTERVSAIFMTYWTRTQQFIARSNERALAEWRATQKRTRNLQASVSDLSWVRYTRFYHNDRCIERKLLALEKELPDKLTALYNEERHQSERIEAQIEERRKEFLIRQAKRQDNPDHEPVEEEFVPGWNDRSLSDIKSSESIQETNNAMVFNDRRGNVNREVSELKEKAAGLRTEFLTKEARYYVVPLPEKDDSDMWTMSGEFLTEKGIHSLRTLIRKERRDRWEYFQIRIALTLSLVTFVIALINFFITTRSPLR
jgi:hypothetical protein